MVENLLNQPEEVMSRGQKISDKVASFGGSWKFIILFAIILFIWILFNSLALTNTFKFDPYPYILMNLILSCIAAMQAPIIMMSQNRQEAKDRLRATHDYNVNIKAEREIRTLNNKLDEYIQMSHDHLKALEKKQEKSPE